MKNNITDWLWLVILIISIITGWVVVLIGLLIASFGVAFIGLAINPPDEISFVSKWGQWGHRIVFALTALTFIAFSFFIVSEFLEKRFHINYTSDDIVIPRYVASKQTHIFHRQSCNIAAKIKEYNMLYYSTRDKAIASGRKPCKICNP